jgi:cytochrome c oxidase cbb3-type subunit III
MNCTAIFIAISLAFTTACGTRNPADVQVVPPNRIMDFSFLYARNCSGCHGPNGSGGAAIGLGDPIYLAIADDATIRRVTAGGVAGTSMPAFAQSSGGMLTDEQVNVIVSGIRTRWAKANVLRDANAPPYAAQGPGDPKRGADVYGTYCSSCHGADGHGSNGSHGGNGSKRASSIVDPSYLALVSDQNLRTTVIVGRRELGAPDWRGDVPGKPMSPADVSDVVAWLVAQRTQFRGQPYSSALQGSSALQAKGGIR